MPQNRSKFLPVGLNSYVLVSCGGDSSVAANQKPQKVFTFEQTGR